MVSALGAAGTPRLIVKVGSALLVDPGGQVRRDWLATLTADIAARVEAGQQIAIVSSGAIALGARRLGLAKGGRASLEDAQAAAATGQIALSQCWAELLGKHGLTAAQMLVTLDDLEDRRRYLNASATLHRLIGLGVVPVINENDSVATAEIRFGDNDRLAARIAQAAGAQGVVLLSDVDGLYTADPRRDPAAAHIPLVAALTPEIEAMAGEAPPGYSSGGMVTKLAAARIALGAGCRMVIAEGKRANPLAAVAEGARCTWFVPASGPRAARKRWIAGTVEPALLLLLLLYSIVLLRVRRSLLPAGVEVDDAVVVGIAPDHIRLFAAEAEAAR